MSNRLNLIANHLAAPASATHPKGVLAGQVAIITGSGQGIGAEAAKLFAAEGAKVVITDIDASKSEAVTKEIVAAGGIAHSIPGDVMDPSFPERLVEETVRKFGGLNILVNNAGFTYDGTIHKMTDKQWETMLTVHNTAPFRLVRAAAKYFRTKNKDANKCIINISSTSGLHGNFGQVNYACAKAGVVGLTKTICKEWGAFGVRANTVAFGYIETRLTAAKEEGAFVEVEGKKVALGIPGGRKKGSDDAVKALSDIPLGRPGSAKEAAGSILLLCSPWASYISGHTLEVTGGRGI
ncbi:NAD(P)-binding protein [Saitoella complicata NRRL Y-17804]|uniref:Ketoreductase domain-containing protein n=1 Tax=Saitoella complicata (strain BCRC 22490 / CBS 7301 / JCM 7358 / NBRC 10748 / NRRL Y-17804) TaxID=698492 RepID=A0A0E9NCT4_SAICN|nr:NAD(P)-binding protein [Saitoella complicata NRRL Y-17804]ODQ49927.1 NAD(P)-binding protein [Saitoella complicata NRRL Y-17804]GAO47649.1 hypothetical protein G7K_1848-t1 [Saitoella complicata NRRL Y-17804]